MNAHVMVRFTSLTINAGIISSFKFLSTLYYRVDFIPI